LATDAGVQATGAVNENSELLAGLGPPPPPVAGGKKADAKIDKPHFGFAKKTSRLLEKVTDIRRPGERS